MDKKPLVINLYAGPGAGKSTTAAGVFFELKSRGINCELVTEFAKDKVWEESFHTLDNQHYIFTKQYHKMFRVKDKVDVIITDAPLLLSLYYGEHMSDNFKGMVKEIFDEFDNMNFFIERVKAYNPMGRMQTEEESREIDKVLCKMLITNNLTFSVIPGDRTAPRVIADMVMERLGLSNEEILDETEKMLKDAMAEGWNIEIECKGIGRNYEMTYEAAARKVDEDIIGVDGYYSRFAVGNTIKELLENLLKFTKK